MSDAAREMAVREVLVAMFSLMRRALRAVPNLDERDSNGRPIVLDLHVELLLAAVPRVEAPDIAAAGRAHMAESAFFPTPAELIAHVRRARDHRLAESADTARLALPAETEDVSEGRRQGNMRAVGDLLDRWRRHDAHLATVRTWTDDAVASAASGGDPAAAAEWRRRQHAHGVRQQARVMLGRPS